MTPEDIEQARRDYREDIERLAEFTDRELYFLGNLHELADPITDGLECSSEERL